MIAVDCTILCGIVLYYKQNLTICTTLPENPHHLVYSQQRSPELSVPIAAAAESASCSGLIRV